MRSPTLVSSPNSAHFRIRCRARSSPISAPVSKPCRFSRFGFNVLAHGVGDHGGETQPQTRRHLGAARSAAAQPNSKHRTALGRPQRHGAAHAADRVMHEH
jgi:hypothetical protein